MIVGEVDCRSNGICRRNATYTKRKQEVSEKWEMHQPWTRLSEKGVMHQPWTRCVGGVHCRRKELSEKWLDPVWKQKAPFRSPICRFLQSKSCVMSAPSLLRVEACSCSLRLSYIIDAHVDNNSTGETSAGVRANPFTEALCYQTASIYFSFSFFSRYATRLL